MALKDISYYLVISFLVFSVIGCSTRSDRAVEGPESIRVEQPSPDQVVRSPLTVTGSARGPWYFEGDFSVKLLTADGRSLGTAVLTARSDWMTSDFVRFEGELNFEKPEGVERGRLKFESANPSGRPEHQKTAVVPVRFSD